MNDVMFLGLSLKGLGKPEQGEDSSFGKSTDKAEGVVN